MSKELVQTYGANYLANRSDQQVTKDVGKTMVAAGGSGLVLGVVAGMLPFITLPMLFVILVLSGSFVYLRGLANSSAA